MATRSIIFLLGILAFFTSARADHEITLRLSYKVVRNPVGGTRPPGATDAAIDSAVAQMNVLLRSYGRGYRFERVDPITEVGAVGGFSRPNPSHYYGINMLDDTGARVQMEDDARNNQTLYAWNPFAINIYFNQGNAGGLCAFPSATLIAIGAGSAGTGWVQLHELGHFFDLCHTQGCPCGCCGTHGETGECHTSPGSDGIPDTLPELACWDRDGIALHNFGVNYAQLSPSQQSRVDDVFFNLMSYHDSSCGQGAPSERLTEQQLDRWADTTFATRSAVRDGRTIYVQSGAASFGTGLSSRPFPTVAEGVGVADGGGDIVLIRPGTYPENFRIIRPVTLRTPRGQTARIGG